MNTYEFVQDVLQTQEGVIFDDLWPCDDKYREVVRLLNMAIHEFNNLQDWTFLKETVILGDTNPRYSGDIVIPKYPLPDYALKVSTLFDDCVKLYAHRGDGQIDERTYIDVPYASPSFKGRKSIFETKKKLLAIKNGRFITFNRMPQDEELDKVVVADVQVRIPDVHVCTTECVDKDGNLVYVDEHGDFLQTPGKCCHIEKEILPYPEVRHYFTLKVASMSGRYSPPAGGYRTELLDQANQALSKLKTIDSAKTFPNIYKKPFIVNIRQV